MMGPATDVVIVGGGVSGLACALKLNMLEPSLRVTIVEAEATMGGKIAGETVSGCIVDGGPDLFVASKVEGTAAYESLRLASRLIAVNPGRLPTFRRHGTLLSEMPGVITDGLVTVRGGMRELVDTMVSALRTVEIRTSQPVTAIDRIDDHYHVKAGNTTLEARAVVAAMPASSFAAVVRAMSPALSEAVSAVRYNPITTVSAAWPSSEVSHPLRGTGYIASQTTAGEVSACTWTSSKIPSRAPRDVVLLRGYCRSSDCAVASRRVLDELARVLGITAPPLFTRSFAWSEGLPVYPSDHSDRLQVIDREAKSLGSFAVAGAAFHGVGIGDCIASGERAAGTVFASVQQDAHVSS